MAWLKDMAYVELHVRTNFSFLTGASHPEEYVRRAFKLGHPAVAITDTNSLAGVVRAHGEAREHGMKILVGAELVLMDGQRLVALPSDRAAYGRLSRLISLGRRRAEKGVCELYAPDVVAHGEGSLFVVLPPDLPDDAFAVRLADWGGRLSGTGSSRGKPSLSRRRRAADRGPRRARQTRRCAAGRHQ